MPTFEIPDGPTTVDVGRPSDPNSKAAATGSATFNVTNTSSEGRDGRLGVQVSGASKAEWFTIDGERERPFAAGETQRASIKISIPNDVAAGEYPFQLRVVAVNDPDNDHAEGPVTTARLGQKKPVTGGGIPWWVWLIIALVVLAGLGIGGWLLFSGDGDEDGEPTNNVVTTETKVPPFIDQKVDAIAADAGGYQIVKNETPNTGRAPRTVYDQDPDPGTPLAAGERVIVSYEPGVAVPDLPANATFSSAPNVLRRAGLRPGSFLCDAASGRPGAVVGRVTAFEPGPRTLVAANSEVNMRAIQPGRCLTRVIRPEIFDRIVVNRVPIERVRTVEGVR